MEESTSRPCGGSALTRGCSEWWVYRQLHQLADLLRGRCVTTCVAFLAICSAANIFTFSTYLNDLKTTFMMTQTQAELVMSMSYLGMGGACIVGYIAQRLGIKMAAVLAWILAVASNLLIWSTTFNIHYYSIHCGLLATYFFTSGFGSGSIFVVTICSTLTSFESDYHGRVMGFLMTGVNVGILIYVALFDAFFYDADPAMPSNLGGYFVLITATLAIANGPGPFIYRGPESPLDEDDDVFLPNETTRLTGGDDNNTEQRPPDAAKQQEGDDHKPGLLTIFRQPLFHCLMWPTCIIMAFQPLNEGNLSIYLNSFELDQYITTVPYVSPISSILVDIFIGCVSDRFTTRTSFNRPRLILGGCVLMAVTFALAIFLFDVIAMMIICLILWDIAVMIVTCNVPSLLIREFGGKCFATIWGLIYLLTALFVFALQNLFAVYYDDATAAHEDTCYGLTCFTVNFVTSIFLCCFSAALILAYIKLKKRDVAESSECP